MIVIVDALMMMVVVVMIIPTIILLTPPPTILLHLLPIIIFGLMNLTPGNITFPTRAHFVPPRTLLFLLFPQPEYFLLLVHNEIPVGTSIPIADLVLGDLDSNMLRVVVTVMVVVGAMPVPLKFVVASAEVLDFPGETLLLELVTHIL